MLAGSKRKCAIGQSLDKNGAIGEKAKMIKSLNAAAWTLGCVFLSLPAAAAIKYDFSSSGMGVSSGATVTGMTVNPTASSDPGPTATIYGVTGTTGSLSSAPVKTWDGLGVQTGSESNPQHATDNSGSYEAVALQFSQAIALTDVSIGWYSNDSDLSILAYTGVGVPTMSTTWAGLTGPGGGWTLLGHYANVHNQPGDSTSLRNDAVNRPAVITSSYWLIAAYNPLVGSGTVYNSGGIGTGAPDYVKINGVAGFVPSTSVPEPSVLALLGVGLLGFAGRFRRRTSA